MLDLDLDISLPAIAIEESPDKKSGHLKKDISPASADVETVSLLMSDERELLKDIQCFEDEAPTSVKKSAWQS